MIAILNTMHLSETFSYIKIVVFWFKFYFYLFTRVQLMIDMIALGMAWSRRCKIIFWTNDCLVYWVIYASVGLDKLTN